MMEIVRKSFLYRLYRKLYSQFAAFLSGYPSKDFFVIGVTGTDGKTTTTNIIHKILNDHVGKTALVSTANIKIGNEELFNDRKMTSLDSFDLQSVLVTAKNNGCKIAVLEVSSHGLDQYRFEGIEFDMAVLTNITPEHLDYHGTFENYVAAKKKLFQYVVGNRKAQKMAVLPKDDESGRRWFEEMSFDKSLNFSINSSSMLRAENIKEYQDKTTFDFNYLGKIYSAEMQLVGQYNVYNMLAGIGAGLLIGLDIEHILQSVKEITPINGRMNAIQHKGIQYYVDFAHTPNALESTLKHLQAIKGQGRIITMFGAPGKRDTFKRPLMGQIAVNYSDIVIVTDDDPDTENRLYIIDQITRTLGKTEGKDFFILPDRKQALKLVVDIAQEGDQVLLAGKGHEQVQLTNFGKKSWNDKQELLSLLQLSS